jgi:hypothetical protein
MAGLKKMQYCYLRTKIKNITYYCGLVMHSITHTAFFLNGLLRLMMITGGIGGFNDAFGKKVLVSINHILACNKADEQ